MRRTPSRLTTTVSPTPPAARADARSSSRIRVMGSGPPSLFVKLVDAVPVRGRRVGGEPGAALRPEGGERVAGALRGEGGERGAGLGEAPPADELLGGLPARDPLDL